VSFGDTRLGPVTDGLQVDDRLGSTLVIRWARRARSATWRCAAADVEWIIDHHPGRQHTDERLETGAAVTGATRPATDAAAHRGLARINGKVTEGALG
jgi:hypothetical protein